MTPSMLYTSTAQVPPRGVGGFVSRLPKNAIKFPLSSADSRRVCSRWCEVITATVLPGVSRSATSAWTPMKLLSAYPSTSMTCPNNSTVAGAGGGRFFGAVMPVPRTGFLDILSASLRLVLAAVDRVCLWVKHRTNLLVFAYAEIPAFGDDFVSDAPPKCALGRLTFEVTDARRQDALARLAKMYSVPPTGPRWPAVARPVDRVVRRQRGQDSP